MEIEKITSIIPEAEISQTGETVVKVPAEKLHQIAETLLNDKENPMDFLRDIVGMDWGEEGLGALYLLESTHTGARITLKAVTADREKALLPTVSDLWKTALIKEREVYDFFGICFLNHPDMRRIFLREDWIGYPMRKDYDMNSNPLRMDNEENADMTDEYFLRPDGTLEGRKNVVFGEDDFVVNIGPQHPSTHGVLRMRTSLEGENIRKIDPILGYIHRGIEKMNESLTYPQTTHTGARITLKAVTADREKALLPTVSDLWKTALIKEREVYDFFGICFLNHPDMRRIFLREDWIGYPMRKDYDMNSNPLRMDNEENADMTDEYFLRPDGTLEGRKNVVFGEDDFVVNIGPQHPSTHGVLRMRTSLEGENIRKIDPILGYIHRGIEKMNESLTYPQTLALTDRLDYLSAHQNRHALCMCIEKAAGIEVPERALYIRTIMDELQRIDSHLLFYSCLVMDMGGLTPFFYGFREREMILDIFEETTGGRLIQNYNMIGGVQADIHPTFQQKVKDFIKHLRSVIQDYHDIFTSNVIADTRLKGVGVLSKEDAISLGCTGGTGRASGWANDVRKHHPYALYDKVDFKEIVYTEGDSFARYMVRMDEIMESCHIIEQLIDNIPEGEFRAKTKPIIKLPEGVFTSSVETSRGEFDVVLESHGDKVPYRLHYRSTGLPLVHAMDTVCRGAKIADLIAIGGTLDFVIPDIDR